MKIRIFKNKKLYIIDIVRKNQIVETFQTNKIDQFQLLDKVQKQIKVIEFYNGVVITFRSNYPKFSKNKIYKLHFNKLKTCLGDIKYKIVKTVINEIDNNVECCFYYINEEVMNFLSNNKILNKLTTLVNDKVVLNKKYNSLILVNNYEISLYNNQILKYYNINNKNIVQYLNVLSSMLFLNYKTRKLYIAIPKEQYNDYLNFVNSLKNEIEERVKIIVEKI